MIVIDADSGFGVTVDKGGSTTMAIDKKWFQRRVADLGLSQRQISQSLSGNPNMLSLITLGKRKVGADELPALASALDTTPEEIMQRLGVEQPAGLRGNSVKCAGEVDETGRIAPASVRTVPQPANATANTRGIIYRAAGSDTLRHGWVFYFEQLTSRAHGIDADTINALCVVEVGDKPGSYVGVVRRGLDRGRYDLVNPFTGEAIVQGISVRSASPVLWIKTG